MLSRYEALALVRDAPDLSLQLPPVAPEYMEDTTAEEVNALLPVALEIAGRLNDAWQISKQDYFHYTEAADDIDKEGTGQSKAWDCLYWRSEAIEKVAREWADYAEDIQRLVTEYEQEGRFL